MLFTDSLVLIFLTDVNNSGVDYMLYGKHTHKKNPQIF